MTPLLQFPLLTLSGLCNRTKTVGDGLGLLELLLAGHGNSPTYPLGPEIPKNGECSRM